MRTLCAAAAALTLALFAAACNSDSGSMTIEEYFTELEQIEADTETRGEALGDPFAGESEGSPDEDAVDEFREQAAAIFRDYLDSFDDLEPPEDVQDLHDEYGEAIGEFAVAFDGYLESVGEGASLEDLTTDAAEAFARSLTRTNNACVELEELATDNGVEVDLRCDND